MNKKYRYLKALKENKIAPSAAYMRKKVPIIPPIYRPMYPLPDGNITTGSANYLYQNMGIVNWASKMPVLKYLSDEDKGEIFTDLYEQSKALAGLKDVAVKGKDQKGFISALGGKGEGPKAGFFQSQVLSKTQDLVGRGTIIPEPKLHVDEVALPEKFCNNDTCVIL